VPGTSSGSYARRVAVDPRTPVIVGAGQVLQRATTIAEAGEPAALMVEAIAGAGADAGLGGIPPAVDSVRIVGLLSWRYGNAAHVVAARAGITADQLAVTHGGGNSPQSLVNSTAVDIAAGRLDAAVLAGGEAWRTRMRARREGVELDWDRAPEDATPVLLGSGLDLVHPDEAARGVTMPVQIYPMFESAIRAAAGRTPADHLVHISELWSRFSAVAAGNPYAWLPEARTAEELRSVSPRNRMIGLPYTKSLNSNNDVDMAAALLICSAQWAADHGVPRDRWVFPQAGTDCHEHTYVSHRWSLAETPAVRRGGRLALELAGADIDDIALVDLYSCFPSAVQLGAASLGLPIDGQLTRTGGLTFAGGPWNSYVLHAIATITNELRERPDELGLVWANGGFVTKHAFGVYGTAPPPGGFRHASPQDEIDALPRRELATGEEAAGTSAIEAYTVMHDRDGAPELAIATCLRDDGRRAWATTRDAGVTAAMLDGEWVGEKVTLDADGTIRL